MKSFKDFLTEAKGKIINAEDHPLYQKRTSHDVGATPDHVAHAALQTDATSQRIMAKGHKHTDGELVGARLNLNVLKNTKVPVMTIHKGTNSRGYKNGSGQGFYKGEAISYHPVVTLKNAHFNVHQQGRENIVSKKQNKHPMASVDGNLHLTKEHSFDGVEARFNPMDHHTFVDGNGHSIKSAEEVTLHGHRAYLRGKIEYHTAETAPVRKGDSPSKATLKEETTYDMYFGEEPAAPEAKTLMQFREEAAVATVAANNTAGIPATGDDKETVVVKKKPTIITRSTVK